MSVLSITNDTLQRLQERATQENISVDQLINQWLKPLPTSNDMASLHKGLSEFTSDTIVLFDLDLRYRYANHAIERLMGIELGNMLGKTDRELGMSEEQANQLKANWQLVIDTQTSQIITFDYMTLQGHRFYESHLNPIFDSTGTIEHLLAITRDITEQKLAQEQLRQSEANLRAILDSARQSFVLIDRQYRIIDIDERGKKTSESIFGKKLNLGDSIYNFVFPQDLDSFNQNFKQALAGETVNLEKLFEDLSGNKLYFDITYYPVIDKNGETIGVCMSNQNITARKQAENNLRQSEMRLRSLLETQSAFVIRTNLQGYITYVSPNWSDKFGWTNDKFIGEHSLKSIHPEDHEKTQQAVQQCIANPNQPIQVTLRKEKKLDGFVWSLWEFVALQDYDGTITEIQCMGFDITQQIESEQLRLEQERLKANLKKEQTFNTLIQKAVYGLSHDIRTPLAVIDMTRNKLDLYFDRLDENKRHEKLESIGRQLNYVVELLDNVTSTIKGSLDTGVFNPEIINLEALCRICIQEIQETSGVNHHLTFITDNHIITANVDETLVSRILINLLSNAVKYSPQNSDIRLELNQRDNWIVLRVVDYGMGIAESDQSHIFKSFYRTQSAQHIDGTGLGLNIVQECVEHHQGRITLESVLEKGTTFTVELPILS